MKVIKTDNKKKDFYKLLGPVFGSRKVEKETHDRFYDDDGKIWYVIEGMGAASVFDKRIKNFWAMNEEAAEQLLSSILKDASGLSGVLPLAYEGAFRRAGFRTEKHSKNFMEVFKDEEN